MRSVRRSHESAGPVAVLGPTWPLYLIVNRYAQDGMPVLT